MARLLGLRKGHLRAHWPELLQVKQMLLKAKGAPTSASRSSASRTRLCFLGDGAPSTRTSNRGRRATLRLTGRRTGFNVFYGGLRACSRGEVPSLLPLLLSHNLPFPSVQWCVMGMLVHPGLGSSSLICVMGDQ